MTTSSSESNVRHTRPSDRGLLHFVATQLDQVAFEEIVRRCQDLVMNVCLRTTGCREDADSAFRSTFIALVSRPRQLRKASCLTSWLDSVAWRTSIRANRFRRKHAMQPVPKHRPEEYPDPLTAIPEDRDRTVLDEELNRLPEDYRTVLVLRYFTGRPASEIARQERTTKGLIDGPLKRARDALRVRLVRRGVTLSVLAAVRSGAATPVAASPVRGILTAAHSFVVARTATSTSSSVQRLIRAEVSGRPVSLLQLMTVALVVVVGCGGLHATWLAAAAASDEQADIETTITLTTADTHADEPTKSNELIPCGEDAPLADAAAESEYDFRGVREKILLAAPGQWGGIAGQILFDGPVPKRRLLHSKGAAIKDSAVCSAKNTLEDSLIVDPGSKGIANCFVYLYESPAPVHPLLATPIEKELIQDQQGCMFVPHGLVVQVGQSVRVTSRDPIAHNVHTFPLRGGMMNMAMGPGGNVVRKPSSAEPLPFQVKCDYHPWMLGYWLVVDHPYAAKTDEYGRFRISGLPAGEHEFRVWHERAGYLDRAYQVAVRGGQTMELEPMRVPESKFDPHGSKRR